MPLQRRWQRHPPSPLSFCGNRSKKFYATESNKNFTLMMYSLIALLSLKADLFGTIGSHYFLIYLYALA